MDSEKWKEDNLYDLATIWGMNIQVENVESKSKTSERNEDVCESKSDNEDEKVWRKRLDNFEQETMFFNLSCRNQQIEGWMRREVWLRACGLNPSSADYIRYKNGYERAVRVAMSSCPGCNLLLDDHIPLYGACNDSDCKHESLEDLFKLHYLSKSGQQSCKRIMLALKEELVLTYCPILFNLICLLLIFVTEFEAFFICKYMVMESQRKSSAKMSKIKEIKKEAVQEKFYFGTSQGKWNMDEYSFLLATEHFARKGLKKYFNCSALNESEQEKNKDVNIQTLQEAKQSNKQNVNKVIVDEEDNLELATFTKDCLHRLFVDILPLRHVMVVLDCFIMEGNASLYKIGLSIVKNIGTRKNRRLGDYLNKNVVLHHRAKTKIDEELKLVNEEEEVDSLNLVQISEYDEESSSIESSASNSDEKNETVEKEPPKEKINRHEAQQVSTDIYPDMFGENVPAQDSTKLGVPMNYSEDDDFDEHKDPKKCYPKQTHGPNISSFDFSSKNNNSSSSMTSDYSDDSASRYQASAKNPRLKMKRSSSMKQVFAHTSLLPGKNRRKSFSRGFSMSEIKGFKSSPNGTRKRRTSISKLFQKSIGRMSSMQNFYSRGSYDSDSYMDDIAFEAIMKSAYGAGFQKLNPHFFDKSDKAYSVELADENAKRSRRKSLGDEVGPIILLHNGKFSVRSLPPSLAPIHFSSELLSQSRIISGIKEMSILLRWLPSTLQARSRSIRVVYTPEEHGFGLQPLYQTCLRNSLGPSILLIEDMNGNVFGGYCSKGFHVNMKDYSAGFIGDESCFVFRLRRNNETCAHVWKFQREKLQKYGKVDEESYHHFARCEHDFLSFGNISVGLSSTEENKLLGPALWLDEDLVNGHTGESTVYGNDPLCRESTRVEQTKNKTSEPHSEPHPSNEILDDGNVESKEHVYFKIKCVEVLSLTNG